MASYEDFNNDFNNDFFDFENTDNFLSSIQPQSQPGVFSPNSLSGDDWMNEAAYNPNYSNSSTNSNNSQLNSDFGQNQFDNTYQQNLYNDFNYSNTQSVSSQNSGLTPVSHSGSSTQTTPEPIKSEKSESDDDVPRKGTTKMNPKNGKKRDKVSHNMIEKKYRTNINTKILMLRDAVPSLRIASGSKDVKLTDLEGLTPASKLNKASVLTKATEYIQHLEKKNEALAQQNIQLQRLIQQANLNPNQSQFTSPNMASSNMAPQYSENSIYSNALQMPPQPQQPPQPNKYLLGGMAAVVGTSLMGGPDSDFRSLSAIPFMPVSFAHPPAIMAQFWYLLKVLLVVGCLANLIVPSLFTQGSKVKLGSLLKTWAFVTLGLQLPNEIDDGKKQEILNKISGSGALSISDYIYLSSCQTTFETCFLTLLVGTLIRDKYPIVNRFMTIGMNLRFSLLLNLNYNGSNKSLIGLNQLIKDVDGISLFDSQSMKTRMINLIEKKPLSSNIQNCRNIVKYIDLYKQDPKDCYKWILSWRLLEIIDELNVSYLNNLSIRDEEDRFNENNKLFKDLRLVGGLIDKIEVQGINEYFKLFQSVLLPQENIKQLMNSIDSHVNVSLDNFNALKNGIELTDDEAISEDEGSDKSIQQSKVSDVEKADLISSLNLVNDEEFIILTTGLSRTFYLNQKKSEALKLLNHLEFDSDKYPLTILGFIGLFNVIDLIINKDNLDKLQEYNELFDKLIRITRFWLNDNEQVLSDNLRGKLSDLIVEKGMILNGGDDNNDE